MYGTAYVTELLFLTAQTAGLIARKVEGYVRVAEFAEMIRDFGAVSEHFFEITG